MAAFRFTSSLLQQAIIIQNLAYLNIFQYQRNKQWFNQKCPLQTQKGNMAKKGIFPGSLKQGYVFSMI
jgi:hypothetical protein